MENFISMLLRVTIIIKLVVRIHTWIHTFEWTFFCTICVVLEFSMSLLKNGRSHLLSAWIIHSSSHHHFLFFYQLRTSGITPFTSSSPFLTYFKADYIEEGGILTKKEWWQREQKKGLIPPIVLFFLYLSHCLALNSALIY